MKLPFLTPVNQLDYACVPYPTTLERGERLQKPYPSVAVAGCGLCCICMTVEFTTGKQLSVNECIDLSVESGANVFGTDMARLGAAAAGRYGLRFETADSVDILCKCLKEGGCAVVNVGRENGVFSDGGHYLFAAGLDREKTGGGTDGPERIWFLDPSFTKQKYDRPGRREKVELREPYIVAAADTVEAECAARRPAFYLFYRKKIVQ